MLVLVTLWLYYFIILSQGTPVSLLDQLSPEQQFETADQEDHGFTDDSWFANDVTLEKESGNASDGRVKSTDVGLCQAIERTFLDLAKVAVVKQQNCES